jgi:hypothetical protein
LEECRALWKQAMGAELVSDLWEARACFQRHFERPACFLAAEDNGGLVGLLPLSWIEESGCHGYFPGETWEGKTWLEQNRVFARSADALKALFEQCPPRRHLRYLLPVDGAAQADWPVDEIGYLFHPPRYGYDFENYLQEFSGKSRKRLSREIAAVEAFGVQTRLDVLEDFDALIGLNVERFGERSYFHDPRFLESFRDLTRWLRENGWLRMTALTIDGDPVAVDMGCLYRGVYTLLAGGASVRYPGLAKLINFHHMRRACDERFEQVDFLCGDFGWKAMFHLTPRPLYLMSDLDAKAEARSQADAGSVARVA